MDDVHEIVVEAVRMRLHQRNRSAKSEFLGDFNTRKKIVKLKGYVCRLRNFDEFFLCNFLTLWPVCYILFGI